MATEAMDQPMKTPWWLVLVEGLALLLLGLMLLINTEETTVVLVVFIGIYWLIAGFFRIMSIFVDQHLWGWNLFMGLLGIAAGIIVVQYPLWSTTIVVDTLIILTGLLGLAFGLGNVIGGVASRSWGTAVVGFFTILIGLVLLANVWLFAFSLPYALGILAIIGGISAIIAAFQMR